MSLAQLLEFVKTRSALPDVIEDERGLSIRATGPQGDEGVMSGASNALGVREIPMHDSLKYVDQLFFPVHGCAVPRPRKNPRSFPALCRIPRSLIGVDQNLCEQLDESRATKKFGMSETDPGLGAIYR